MALIPSSRLHESADMGMGNKDSTDPGDVGAAQIGISALVIPFIWGSP